jgi:hypothetical protein
MDEVKWESDYAKKKHGQQLSSIKNPPSSHQSYSQGKGYQHPPTKAYQHHGYHSHQHHGQDSFSHKQPANHPTKTTPQATNQQGQGSSNYKNSANLTCLKCGEKGHKAEQCLKVNLLNIPCLFGSMSAPPILKPGKIGDRPVQMFMDSGADAAIISRHLLPDQFIQCTPVAITGVNSQDQPKLCQTALFPAEIDGHSFQMFAAVTDEDLPHSCIIGRAIPGLDMKWDISISKPGTIEIQTGEAGERAIQEVQVTANDPAVTSPLLQPSSKVLPVFQQEQTASADSHWLQQQPHQHLQPAPTNSSSTPLQTPDLDNLSPAEIALVRTRAQAQREQLQQQKNDAATAASNAPITHPDTIPALDSANSADRPDKAEQTTPNTQPQARLCLENSSTPPVDTCPTAPSEAHHNTGSSSEAHQRVRHSSSTHSSSSQPEGTDATVEEFHQPDYTITTAPFTSEDLKREQKADTALQKCWDLAKEPLPTEYIIKDDILYWIDPKPLQLDNPHKIVVPQSLQSKVLQVGHSCSGHFGTRKTKAHIQAHFHWPSQDIADRPTKSHSLGVILTPGAVTFSTQFIPTLVVHIYIGLMAISLLAWC